MKCIRYNGELYRYRVTMGDIEAYQSLKQQEQGDWQRILGLPASCEVEYPTNLLPIVEYRQMCAAAGLMAHYSEMEPEEIIDAYNGHNRLIYDLGNLIIVAVRKAFDSNAEPFVYTEEHTREETFDIFKKELSE